MYMRIQEVIDECSSEPDCLIWENLSNLRGCPWNANNNINNYGETNMKGDY